MDDLVRCIIKRYDPDILGIPGYWYDTGEVELLVTNTQRIWMPTGAAEVLKDIEVRTALSHKH